MARPYQQSPQQAGGRRRILRIGVLLGGKIVEERLIRDRTPVSIGQSSKNTFSVPLEHLPREFTLFAIDQDRYRLQFAGKMDGRVSDGAQVYTFEQVKGSRAQQVGDHWVMPLSDAARGKVSIGDLTLLFQFVTEPPIQPRPMLPASVRGTLAERVDPQLAVICAISILLHFGIAIAAWVHDLPKKKSAVRAVMQTVDVETIDMVEPIPPPPPPPDENAAAGDAKTDAGDKKAESKPDKSPSKGDKSPKPEIGGGMSDEERKAALEEEARAYVAIMTGGNQSAGGAAEMAATSAGGDLDQQTREVKEGDAKLEVGGGKGGTRGGGDPRKGTGGKTQTTDTGGVDSAGGGKGPEKTPKGRVKLTGTKGLDDDESLTADMVSGKIQKVYMSALQRCYKEQLKTDPSLRAKVTLSFEVNASARVGSPEADSDSGPLNDCIEKLMASWSFSKPDNPPAAFQISLQFLPE